MPVTRKQKSNARRSREADMISNLENINLMIRSGLSERENRDFGNSVMRPESPSFDALIDHSFNSHSNSRENEITRFAVDGENTTEGDSGSELNRLSGELNQSITQEINGLMNRVSLQIKTAINEATNEQVLPQLQTSLRSVYRQQSQEDGSLRARDWNINLKIVLAGKSEVAL